MTITKKEKAALAVIFMLTLVALAIFLSWAMTVRLAAEAERIWHPPLVTESQWSRFHHTEAPW